MYSLCFYIWFCLFFIFVFFEEKIVNYVVNCSVNKFKGIFGESGSDVSFCLLGKGEFSCGECSYIWKSCEFF